GRRLGGRPMTPRPRGHILPGDGIIDPVGIEIARPRRQAGRTHRSRAARQAPPGKGGHVMTGTLTMSGKWAEQALCAQADPRAWFPDKGGSPALAKRICAACPVRAQCLDYAVSGADTWGGIATGIWGGTTPRERAQLRHQPEGLPRDEQVPGPQ